MNAQIAAVALGGALGSALRYSVGIWLAGSFPWGTLLVNVLGSLILGVLAALGEGLSPSGRLLLGAGLCGGFTTFSALSVETLRLAQDGRLGAAALNLGLNLGLGLGAAWLGLALGARLTSG